MKDFLKGITLLIFAPIIGLAILTIGLPKFLMNDIQKWKEENK